MSSTLDFVNVIMALVVVAGFGYVTYAALAMRRTLGSGLYRRQALGVGLVAVGFTALYLFNFDSDSFLDPVVFYATAFFLLYWVDSSILASRASDPVYRDTLGWSRLRLVYWVVSVASVPIVFGLLAYYSSIGFQGLPGYVNVVLPILFALPIYAAVVAGAVVMPIAARRSRDLTLRRSLEWLVLFIAIQLVLQGIVVPLVSSDPSDPKAIFVDGVAMLLGAYPLLQSARRLVPIYSFHKEYD